MEVTAQVHGGGRLPQGGSHPAGRPLPGVRRELHLARRQAGQRAAQQVIPPLPFTISAYRRPSSPSHHLCAAKYIRRVLRRCCKGHTGHDGRTSAAFCPGLICCCLMMLCSSGCDILTMAVETRTHARLAVKTSWRRPLCQCQYTKQLVTSIPDLPSSNSTRCTHHLNDGWPRCIINDELEPWFFSFRKRQSVLTVVFILFVPSRTAIQCQWMHGLRGSLPSLSDLPSIISARCIHHFNDC